MQITKVLSLSDEEVTKLIEAGVILGSIRDTEYDELSEETTELLSGLKNVLNELTK